MENVPSDAPAFVIAAHRAVNKVATFEGRDNASVAWDHYVAAQGGVDCGRNYRVRIAKAQSDAIGRYGETGAPVIVGIEYFEVAKVRDAIGNWIDVLPRTVTVESKRFTWEIMRPATSAISASGQPWRAAAATSTTARRAGGSSGPGHVETGSAIGFDFGFERAQRAPWTCVNNCTGGGENGRFEGGIFGADGGAAGGGDIEGSYSKAFSNRKAARGEVLGAGYAADSESRSTLTR